MVGVCDEVCLVFYGVTFFWLCCAHMACIPVIQEYNLLIHCIKCIILSVFLLVVLYARFRILRSMIDWFLNILLLLFAIYLHQFVDF